MSNKMMFRKTLLATSLAACSAMAQAEFSANVALTSDYVWRGVSQTNEDPAIQGGFDFAAKSGLYIGTWASNVEFGGDEHMELDLYGGWSGEFGGIGVDVGLIRYFYFDDTGINFTEGYLGGSYGPFSAKISHDFDNENTYIEAGLDFSLPSDVTLSLHVGNFDFDGGADYTDYKVGVSKEVKGFGFDLSYYDTDVDTPISDGRVVFTVSKSM